MKWTWAFGSNLNVRQMISRCPTARPFASLILPNAVLRFRGVADVAYLKGAECPGGLWTITEEDERILDIYEGVSTGLYEKKHLRLKIDGKVERVIYYQMVRLGIAPPSQEYYDSIVEGYRDFSLPIDRLERALDHSWRRMRKTPFLRARHRRRGFPTLAPKPTTDNGGIR